MANKSCQQSRSLKTIIWSIGSCLSGDGRRIDYVFMVGMIVHWSISQFILGSVYHWPCLDSYSPGQDMCPQCMFNPPLPPVSTPDDAVLIFCDNNRIYGLITFVRSLRTVQSAAAIVLFGMKPPYNHSILLTNCGVTFQPYPYKPLKCKYYYNSVRFLEMKKYLQEHSQVNRALLSDIDVVFQADPFIQPVGDDELVLSTESIIYNSSISNTKWLGKFIKKFGEPGELPLETYRFKDIINIGLLYGRRRTLLVYLGAFAERFYNHSSSLAGFCGLGFDQAIVNSFYHNNYFGDMIKFTVVHPTMANLTFPCQAAALIETQNRPFGDWRVINDTSHFMLVIHGWDKRVTMKQAVREKCPSIGSDDFAKHITEIQ